MRRRLFCLVWLLCQTADALPKPQGLPLLNIPCSIRGVALVGGDLPEGDGGGGIRAKDAEECQFECFRRANCFYWSHVAEWRVGCYLKTEAGEERKLEGAITGWRADNCGVQTATEKDRTGGLLDDSGRGFFKAQCSGNLDFTIFSVSSCKLNDIALLGDDLPPTMNGDGIPARSFVECRKACRDQIGCKAFTFIPDWDLGCFLKSGRGEESDFLGAESGTLAHCSEALREKVETDGSAVRGPSRLQPTSLPRLTALQQQRNQQQARPSPVVRPQSLPQNPFRARPNPQPARPFQNPQNIPGVVQSHLQLPAGEDCIFENTNFLGGGLSEEEGGQGIETADYSGCDEECLRRPKCTHWTFVSKWKVNCYLKSRLGEKSEFDGAVSGTYGSHCDAVSSPAPQASPSPVRSSGDVQLVFAQGTDECLFEDTNFLGGGLSAEEGGQGIETADPQDCSQECRDRPQCHYWTFVGKWKVNCYLKSRLGEKSEFEGGVSGTYGPRCDVIKGTSGSSDECLFEDTNFLGGGLTVEEGGQGIETPDFAACSQECRDRPQCNYWTFVGKWRVNCYLKSRLGEKSEFEGAISGTYKGHCSVAGAPLKSAPLISAAASPAIGTRNNVAPAAPQITRMAALPAGVKDRSGCRFAGTNFLGGDLSHQEGGHGIETTSPDDCRIECSRREKCSFWTFVKQWKVNCYLKATKGPDRPMEGATSGSLFVACESEVEEELGQLGDIRSNDHECAYNDVNFLGADLPASHGGLGVAMESAEECRADCVTKPFCKAWTFVKDWRVSCYLKSDSVTPQKKKGAVSGTVGVRCEAGATSLGVSSSLPLKAGSNGNRAHINPQIVAAPTNNRKDHCFYPGLNLQGGDLTDEQGGNGLAVSAPDDCSAECERRSVCTHWTFVDKWKVNCYLKSAYDSQSQKEGATSGSIGVKCQDYTPPSFAVESESEPESAQTRTSKVPKNPSSAPDNVCFFQKTNLLGGDLPEAESGQGIPTDDANNCAVACYQNEKCVYWVWVEGWQRNCFLKSHFTDEEELKGAVSGSIGLACS